MAKLAGFSEEDLKKIDEVGWVASMALVLMGNYSQTGHFGGPLAYTPANVALHLGGGQNGGLLYDIRNPKHPLTDKYMLAGGHCAPTNYSLWMVLYEALYRHHQATGDDSFKFDPEVAIMSIDALGFRRSPGAVKVLLQENGVDEDPIFAQHKLRGIRALMGHCESTDVTNDVNGGPSGIGVANSAGKAMFWDRIRAPQDIKVWCLEGEFAFTEGHAQEIKTLALAQKVGKRLRMFFSYNNAGIDDALVGGVIDKQFEAIYDMCQQFSSYGWNVFHLKEGNSYEKLLETFKVMEEWDENDKRPMVLVAHTVKGWWPGVDAEGKVAGGQKPDQLVGYPSHPYGLAQNSPYFVALCESFEQKFNVKFQGVREGKPGNEPARLREFMTNIQICLSVLDQNDGALRRWTAERLLAIAGAFHQSRQGPAWTDCLARVVPEGGDPFADPRLKPENLPRETQSVSVVHPDTGKAIEKTIQLFQPAGAKMGTRRAISEIGKWLNYVTGNRWITVAADLSHSINVEGCHFTGHYDPVTNPSGTRIRAGIQEACNAATMCGLASQTLSLKNPQEEHQGWWGTSGTYGAFTPLMYTPMRIFSQQNQDSPFKLGVVTIVAGHSGPETAADGRSHFGIFAPQVWHLFPRNQIINLYFNDYNDVAPGYFAAVQMCMERKESSIIVIHVARPDSVVVDRNTLADKDILSAARGAYVVRDWKEGQPRQGTILVQGCSAFANVIAVLPTLEAEGLNVRVVAVVSEELFRAQPVEYQKQVLPDGQLLDSTFVTTGTKRFPPLSGLGPLAEQYCLSSDFDDRWRTGGLEPDVIAEAQLDEESILRGIRRFVQDRDARVARLRAALADL